MAKYKGDFDLDLQVAELFEGYYHFTVEVAEVSRALGISYRAAIALNETFRDGAVFTSHHKARR